MNEGDTVLVALPQSDGQVKNRPTLVLRKMPRTMTILFVVYHPNCNEKSRGLMTLLRKMMLIL